MTLTELAYIPQFKSSVPQDFPPLQTPLANSKSSSYPKLLYKLTTNQMCSWMSFLFLLFARRAYRTQENTDLYLQVYYIVKDMIGKGYSVQSGEEIHKVKFGRFLNARAFVGLYHSPTRWIHSPTWKFLNLVLFGFLWRLHQCRYWLSLQALSSLWRTCGETESYKFLIMAWSFWWSAPSRNLPGVTSLQEKTFQSSRKFWRIWEFDVRCSYPQEITKILGALCQKLGPKTKY